RRPIPVTTSSRRTSVASGLSVWSSVDISRSPSRDQQNRPSRPSTEGGVTTALTYYRSVTANVALSHQRRFRLPGYVGCDPSSGSQSDHTKTTFGAIFDQIALQQIRG